MRISDWSSDVCSSDLPQARRPELTSTLANEDLGGLAGWVVDVIERIGAPGVGALVALETAFPPIPSEVILPFAGFSAARTCSSCSRPARRQIGRASWRERVCQYV